MYKSHVHTPHFAHSRTEESSSQKTSLLSVTMDFKPLSLFIVMAILYVVHGGSKTTGKFSLTDKRKCTWKEMSAPDHGKSYRKLQISCNGIQKKDLAPIKCSYVGNPHTCSWYKQNNNQLPYYKCLVNKLKKDDKPCNDDKVICKNHCDDVEFKKIKPNNEDLDLDDSMDSNSDEVFVFDPEMFEDFEEDDLMFRPYV